MAQRGAEGDAGLTQSLAEKMAGVMGRYGRQQSEPEREVARAVGRSLGAQDAAKAGHEHGEPTPEQRVIGDAVRVLINEALAPVFGYLTRQESAKPWEQVPIRNRALMVAVVNSLIAQGVIRCG
jgi:hypothetical protein